MFEIKYLLRNSVIAAIYVVLTVTLGPIAYGANSGYQFRLGEALMVLAFFNPKYSLGLILGCFIANFYSPFGLIDIIVGTFSTIIVCLVYRYIRNIYISTILNTFVIGLIVGIEVAYIVNLPYLITIFQVAVCELVVLILGIILFKYLYSKEYSRELLE